MNDLDIQKWLTIIGMGIVIIICIILMINAIYTKDQELFVNSFLWMLTSPISGFLFIVFGGAILCMLIIMGIPYVLWEGITYLTKKIKEKRRMKRILLMLLTLGFGLGLVAQTKTQKESFHYYKCVNSKQVRDKQENIAVSESVGFITLADKKVYVGKFCYKFDHFIDDEQILMYSKDSDTEKYHTAILYRKSIEDEFRIEFYYVQNQVTYIDTYYFN